MARSTRSRRSSLITSVTSGTSGRAAARGAGTLALECQFYGLVRRARMPATSARTSRSLAAVTDRYGGDVLGGDWRRPPRGRSAEVAAETGLVVEDVETGWVRRRRARREGRRGARRAPGGPARPHQGLPARPRLPVDGAPGRAHPARRAAGPRCSGRGGPPRGPRAARAPSQGARARVAPGSRIFVEGSHDAELVEKVWGDDLRVEGVVVEMLDGVDDLAGAIRDFAPGPGPADGRARRPPRARAPRSAGVVDEAARGRPLRRARARRSATRTSTCGSRCGPSASGCDAWPVIPRGTSLEARHRAPSSAGRTARQADIALAWKRILGTVRTYADLEPTLLGRRRGAHRLRHRSG